MTKYKLLSLLFSLAALMAAAVIVGSAIGSLDRVPLQQTKAMLEAGKSRLETSVGALGAGLTTLAQASAAEKDVGQAVAGLSKALKSAKPIEERPPPQQARIDKASEKLDGLRTTFRGTTTAISGLSFADEEGIVIETDSEVIKEGEALALPPLHPPPPAEGGESVLLEGEGSLVQFALAGHTLDAVTTGGGKLFFVAAAPVYKKKEVVGAALVDRRLTALPPTPGVDAILVIGGTVALGEAPAGFSEPAAVTEEPFLAVPRDAGAKAPGLLGAVELPYFFPGSDHQPGLWAQRFAVSGTQNAWGYVFADLTPIYGEIHGLQDWVILLALAIWALHFIFVFFDGRGLRKGVDKVSDFLATVLQSATDARNLPERKVPGSVRRLTRLINQVLEHYVGSGQVSALASSPTVDDVISKAKVDGEDGATGDEGSGAPDFEGLEFKGIEGSGTLDVDRKPPAAGEIGEAGDGYDDSLAAEGQAAAEAAENDAGDEKLPAGMATDAIDQLDDLGSGKGKGKGKVATPPPPPPDDIGEPFSGNEAPETTTEMMQVTPDFIDKIKAEVETKRSTGKQMADVDAELADLASNPRAAAAKGKPATSKAPLPPPAKGGAPKPPGAAPKPPSGGPDEGAATAVMQVTPELIAQMKAVGKADAAAKGAAPAAKAGGAGKDADREAHFHEVYEAFVKTRKECGEKGDLTYDKFALRLVESRDAVMQKHKCSDVRFQVYVKNGKAALKATPAK